MTDTCYSLKAPKVKAAFFFFILLKSKDVSITFFQAVYEYEDIFWYSLIPITNTDAEMSNLFSIKGAICKDWPPV